jgi:hypothetical protein
MINQKFEIRTRYKGSGNMRRMKTVEAPTGMHALQQYAEGRQAIIRRDNYGWIATILIGNGKLRDFRASRIP